MDMPFEAKSSGMMRASNDRESKYNSFAEVLDLLDSRLARLDEVIQDMGMKLSPLLTPQESIPDESVPGDRETGSDVAGRIMTFNRRLSNATEELVGIQRRVDL